MKLKTHTQILIAIGVGIVLGVLLGPHAVHIKIIGDLFIRLLRMIIIPLIVASMITGVVSIGHAGKLGRMGLRTLLYYMATTLLAVLVGLILVNVIQPGAGVTVPAQDQAAAPTAEPPTFVSIITDIIPRNIIAAMSQDNVLAVIFFSLLFGVALTSVGSRAQPLIDLFGSLNAVMLRITDWIMVLAPFGVAALMAYTIGSMGLEAIGSLAKYMATVLIGLGIHAAITLPLLLVFIAHVSPWRFIRHVFSAIATAFSTASSAATLPVTMNCLEENAGISNKVAGFVIPIGATVNMDGTALYEAVAAMFIAQAYGVQMSLAQQIIIMLTATLASVGAAAIPSAGLFTMMIVLQAVNLPLEGIAMILAVDRILDMFRTAVNVWGDTCGAAVIARTEGEQLR